MANWIKQKESSILNLCSGSTVLVKFLDSSNGITMDDGSSIDISWMRTGIDVHATTGDYTVNDIREYKVIT